MRLESCIEFGEESLHQKLTVAALMRFSWQVSNVCSVKRRPFCSRVSEPGVNAVLILLICKTVCICNDHHNNDDCDNMLCIPVQVLGICDPYLFVTVGISCLMLQIVWAITLQPRDLSKHCMFNMSYSKRKRCKHNMTQHSTI